MENFGKICALFLALIVAIFISGFMVMTFWGWFIMPIFTVQSLTLIESIGLSLFVNYLTVKLQKKEEERSVEESLKLMVKGFFYALVLLGIGWCVHLFY